MSKHTPGPWRVFAAPTAIFAEGRKEVVHWSGFDSSDFQKDIKANARLIAAAPELLEACKKTIELFCTLPNQRYSGLIVACAEIVEAAIQKAEGGE
jgi:hypothetical protein